MDEEAVVKCCCCCCCMLNVVAWTKNSARYFMIGVSALRSLLPIKWKWMKGRVKEWIVVPCKTRAEYTAVFEETKKVAVCVVKDRNVSSVVLRESRRRKERGEEWTFALHMTQFLKGGRRMRVSYR